MPWRDTDVLFLVPPAAALAAAEQVLAARVALCAGAALAGAVLAVDRRMWGSGHRAVIGAHARGARAVSLPALGAAGAWGVQALGAVFGGQVGAGLYGAGRTGLTLSVALLLLTLAGRYRAGRVARAHPCLAVVDLAGPVADLPAVSTRPLADLERIAQAGYGVVQHSTRPRVIRFDEVAALADRPLTTGAWWRLGRAADWVDGARPLRSLDRLPAGDDVWLVRAGNLVVGTLTAATLGQGAKESAGRAAAPAAASIE